MKRHLLLGVTFNQTLISMQIWPCLGWHQEPQTASTCSAGIVRILLSQRCRSCPSQREYPLLQSTASLTTHRRKHNAYH